MGIFSDECVYCGNKVRKTARFCNHCGKPAPGGWWKCPSCGKWIGNDSQFCPHCNTPLYPESRPDLAGGVWQKAHTRFAERFEAGDAKRLLVNGLQIQEGTVAVLLDAGRVSDILKAGRHEPDSVLRKINWFGNPPPRSFVLVDVGEVAVPISVTALHTADPFPIEFYGEVIVRFRGEKEAAQQFIANCLKEKRTLEFADISERIQSLVRIAVTDCCTATKLDDLVRDPERRIRLHERMTRDLKADFDSCGLEVVRVSSAEFTGDEYEEYVEKLSEVDQKRREVEYQDAIRHLADRETMEAYRDADSLRTYKEAIDAEYRVSHETREREFQLLKQNWQHDDLVYRRLVELEDQQHRHELENREADHGIALDTKKGDHRRDEDVKDATTAAKVQSIHTAQDITDSKGWLDVRAMKDKLEASRKENEAARRKGMSLEEMLADIDDPDKRADLVKVFKMKAQAEMTEKQILATQGITSTNDAFVDEMKRLYANAGEREDRNLAKMLEPATEAAKHVSNGPNLYK